MTQPGQLMFALGPDILMMGGAMVLLLWAGWRPETDAHQRNVGIASIILCVSVLVAIAYYVARADGSTPGAIAVDNFRWAADVVFLIATIATIALSMDYNSREGIMPAESHVLVLFATAGMMILAAARDLMIVFLGIEIMSIAVYVLAGLDRRSERSAEGAIKYFLLGAFSTAFLLYGIALVYGATGTTDISLMGDRVQQLGLARNTMLSVGVGLILVGFGFKVALAPFHMWAPDVYEGAPTPITAYMAAAVKAAAFAAFLRVWVEAFAAIPAVWHGPVWWLAVATMFGGNLIALAQRNIKRMLAYSSIAHAGYILVAIASGTAAASSAFLFYLFAYTIATFGAFAVIVAVNDRGESRLSLDDFSGLWADRPWLAAAMAVFMLALLGFPIFGGIGFFAKWYILQAALQAPEPQTRLAVILVITSLISAGYYLHVVRVMFMRPPAESRAAARPAGTWTKAVVAASAVAILILGILPNVLVTFTQQSRPVRPIRPVAAESVRAPLIPAAAPSEIGRVP